MKKTNLNLAIIILLSTIATITLSSCMGLMMLGGGDSHSEHSTPATKTFSNDSLKVLVTFPTLSAKKESEIIVEIFNTNRKKNFTTQFIKATIEMQMSDSHSKHDGMKQMGEHSMEPQEITFTIDSSTEQYKGKFILETDGTYQFTITIGDESPFKFSFTENVKSNSSGHSMGMMGMENKPTAYIVLGAIAMAGMMILMVGIRGRIF